MTHDARKYLADILAEIKNIALFVKDIPDFTAYEADLRTQYAVERSLAIIGEAATKLKQIDATIMITNLRQIIATRNLIIHAYESVSNVIVWAIIITELPLLEQQTIALLDKYSRIE